MLNIGQSVFCACDIDILEYSVKEVRLSDSLTTYVLRSKKSVGRNRWVEVLVAHGASETLRYIELLGSDFGDCEYSLEPFTNGSYHTTLEAAKAQFGKVQVHLLENKRDQLKRDLANVEVQIKKWAVLGS
jgi:hypothetical protein